MKILTLRSNLKEALGVVGLSVGNNSNLPILKNVLIEAKNNQIKILSTNLETAITYQISGKSMEEGITTIDFKLFDDLVDALKSERLDIEKKQKKIEIKTDNYEASLPINNAEEFPIIPKIKKLDEFLEISSSIFKDALEQLVIVVKNSEIRPELGSILFNLNSKSLKLAATDSFRLVEKTFSPNVYQNKFNSEFKILIPSKTAENLIRIIKDDQPLKIYYDGSQVLFQTNEIDFISHLIDGVYPDYQAIIPSSFSTEIITDREELIQALKLAGIFSGSTNEVKIKISKEKKNLEIFSPDQTLGENRYFLKAKINGDALSIDFNWKYLTDGLRILKGGEEIFLGINNSDKPVVLKIPKDESIFYLLMPILK